MLKKSVVLGFPNFEFLNGCIFPVNDNIDIRIGHIQGIKLLLGIAHLIAHQGGIDGWIFWTKPEGLLTANNIHPQPDSRYGKAIFRLHIGHGIIIV